MPLPLTAFPYFGGKSARRIRNAILAALPPHTAYIEPFGGAASILLAKPPARIEVYNDINGGIVNFFEVVADPALFEQFRRRIDLLPYSRALYCKCRETWEATPDPVERAAKWYVVARQSFSGEFGGSWCFAVNRSNGGMAGKVNAWLSGIARLPELHARLQRVQIEHCDWRVALDRYSGPGWLAYCDPPYVMSTRKNGKYAHELTADDHRDLIETLLDYRGAVVLSGYASDLYRPLSEAGWDTREVAVNCYAAGRTRVSGLQGTGNAREKQSRTEVIWRNPEAIRRLADRDTLSLFAPPTLATMREDI